MILRSDEAGKKMDDVLIGQTITDVKKDMYGLYLCFGDGSRLRFFADDWDGVVWEYEASS